MTHEIDQKPAVLPLILYGLQWWAVAMPSIVILGLVAAKMQYPDNPAAQIAILQRLFCISGLASAGQVLFGHRLPVVTGPASVLLIGMAACRSSSHASVNTAILLGGVLVTFLAASGLLGRIQTVFTARVLIEIMLLIPFTLAPSILGLVFQNPAQHLFNMIFAPLFLVAMLIVGRVLRGVWKATTIIWVMLAGSLIIYAVYGFPPAIDVTEGTAPPLVTSFEFDPGVVLSFLLCALAMTINEVSSVQAVGQALNAGAMSARSRRGVLVNGVANIVSGLTGVMGPVDYTTSAGIIASTRCASRYPFLPAAALLVACSLFPSLLAVLLALPGPVLGMVLFYVMVTQFAAGLRMTVDKRVVSTFDDGLTLAIPLMLATLVAFLPAEIVARVPALVRPIFGNAFVVGVIAVFVMEHGYNRASPDR